MSQAKVDKYKQEKANRQKIMKREKMERLAWKIGGSVVGLFMIAWIGFSVWDKTYVEVPKSYEISTDAISDYLSDIADNLE